MVQGVGFTFDAAAASSQSRPSGTDGNGKHVRPEAEHTSEQLSPILPNSTPNVSQVCEGFVMRRLKPSSATPKPNLG